MKKIFLIICLTLLQFSCNSENHYHDGKYHTEIDVFGVPFSKIDYTISGSEIIIDNSITGISKLKCQQYQDRIEYTEENGTVKVMSILENGDIKVTDQIVLKRITK